MSTTNKLHTDPATPLNTAVQGFRVRLWDGDGFDELRHLADPTPTGRQILNQFDRAPADEYTLFMWCGDAELHTVELDRVLDLRSRGVERFFAFHTDRIYHWILDGRRYPWGAPTISESLVRLIGRVPNRQAIVLEKREEPDQVLDTHSWVNLDAMGIERMTTQARSWRLNVQGVIIDSEISEIRVSDALTKAGFDPNTGWIAILKTRDAPKKSVALTDLIDLSQPGIERLRLTPKEIINGETATELRHEFALPVKDQTYLQAQSVTWETLIDQGRRWLILRSYPLPNGLNISETDVAIEIPTTYPSSGLDMFYCAPTISREDLRPVVQTNVTQVIDGVTYQRWSRHRSASTPWNRETDSLISHMALIETALAIEGLQ